MTDKTTQTQPMREKQQGLSMHDNIGYWCDCCCCEAEDRWRNLADDFDVDLSDYETRPRPPVDDH